MASIKDGDDKKNAKVRNEQDLAVLEPDEIDLPVQGLKFDIEDLEEWTEEQITGMEQDRDEWHERRKIYMPEFEELLRDNRIDGPWEGSADFHVPLTMWMMKQMHARVYAALIGDGYGFTTVPQEKMDRERAEEVDQTMRWAITSYANEWEGISLTIDDWIWDICKEGWGVIKIGWEKKFQKVALTASELERFNRNASVEQVLEGMINLVKTWDGPKVVTCDHESILFPGRSANSSDMNEFPLVAHLIEFSDEQIQARINDGLWMKKPAQQLLKFKTSSTSKGSTKVDDIQRLKDAAQGVRSMDSNTPTNRSLRGIWECYARVDVDNDSIEEDLVYWYAPDIKKIVRYTTLDRVNVSMKRPLYKVDFIRRPRRTYGIGMPELLYSMNKEVDAMHNQRIDFGTIASIPTFFYRPLSGLKGEKMRLTPGEGIPVQNPRNDIYIPNFNMNTNFTRNEEGMVVTYAERLAALPAITSGQSPTPSGPSSTATGMTSLIAQTGFDFDVILNRFKTSYQGVLKNIHSLLTMRMPDGMKFRVLGEGNSEVLDENGLPLFREKISRMSLYGDFDFRIRANDRALNREVEKQDALVVANVLMNPILLQSGIVQPNNLYQIAKNILKKRGEIDIDMFITSPQNVEKPLSTINEIVVLVQGQMPKIVMNDDHQGKISSLQMYLESPQFANDVAQGIVDRTVPDLFRKAIAKHEQLQSAIQAQANQANVTGQQVGTSLGARMSGEVNQQTGRGMAQDQQLRAQQQAVEMPELRQGLQTAGGLEIPSFGL